MEQIITDWQKIVSEIEAGGLTQVEIARRCSCSQASISDIKRGATSEPRFGLGTLLQILHRQIVVDSDQQ